ncbi:unnamed protein product [Nesidiocoris tenuis]|uniref:Uncharacterized protein n=1 Tax=Nesidiocoris tenuis TaxID=355587 RepID=A0A6H5HB23_9HEMI|nr:unnamed protein product [Nesidiocoris tenuis]
MFEVGIAKINRPSNVKFSMIVCNYENILFGIAQITATWKTKNIAYPKATISIFTSFYDSMCTCRHVRPSRKRDRRLHRQYGQRNRSSPPLMRGVDPARACNEVAFSFSSMRIYVDALGGSGEPASLQRPTWLKEKSKKALDVQENLDIFKETLLGSGRPIRLAKPLPLRDTIDSHSVKTCEYDFWRKRGFQLFWELLALPTVWWHHN